MGRFYSYLNKQQKEFWLNVAEQINEASIYEPKYPFGHKVVLKSSAVDTFNKKINPSIENGIFIKVAPTNKNVEMVSFGGSGAEVYLQHEKTKRIFYITGSNANISTKFNHVKDEGGINWHNIPTLETAQCLGIFLDGVAMLKDISSEKNITFWKTEVNRALAISTDWNPQGSSMILKHIDNISLGDFIQIALLAAGTTIFKSKIAPHMNHIVHKNIVNYYNAEEQNPFLTSRGVKENTADAILTNVPAAQLIDAMKNNKIDFNDKGICTIKGTKIQFVQMSLKKGKGKAQLGKFLSSIQQKYDIPRFVDLLNISLNEQYNYTFFNEGVMGDILQALQNVGAKVFQTMKIIVSKIMSMVIDTVQKMNNLIASQQSKDFKFLEKELEVPSGYFTECFKHDENGNLLIENNQLILEKSETLTDRLKGLTLQQQNKLAQSVKTRLENFSKNANSVTTILIRINDYVEKINKSLSLEAILKLFANFTAVIIYDKMIINHAKNSKQMINSLIDIQREIYFGKTSLPLYKVYGADNENDKDTYEYYGTSKDFVSQKTNELVKNKEIAVAFRAKVDSSTKGYYIFVSHLLNGINEEGEWEYNEIRMGTNQGSANFAFVLEGTTTLPYSRMISRYE